MKENQKQTQYVAKKSNSDGYIDYTAAENAVWQKLYERQMILVRDRACDAFLDGLEKIQLRPEQIPQCIDVSARLMSLTGWSVTPVDALIPFDVFFALLANRQFPAASFIRCEKELDYLQEPDIFHELFGHCPMLTHPEFAAFTQKIGEFGVKANKSEQSMLARLYWFTVEFGLIETAQGLRIYGGGILSSKGETVYALESDKPIRQPLDLLTILRTPYRYDEMQLTYFVIKSFESLYAQIEQDLFAVFKEAYQLGMLPNRHDKKPTDFHTC